MTEFLLIEIYDNCMLRNINTIDNQVTVKLPVSLPFPNFIKILASRRIKKKSRVNTRI